MPALIITKSIQDRATAPVQVELDKTSTSPMFATHVKFKIALVAQIQQQPALNATTTLCLITINV